MSSFMVSEDCLSNIMGLLHMKGILNDGYGIPLLKGKYLDFFDLYEAEEQIWQDLIDLNIEALKQRYPDDNEVMWDQTKDYKLKINYSVSIYQGLKSLRCFLYQCSEGEISNTKLFKLLDDISITVAWNIVYSIPEFNQAEWD